MSVPTGTPSSGSQIDILSLPSQGDLQNHPNANTPPDNVFSILHDDAAAKGVVHDWASCHAKMMDNLLRPPRELLEKAARSFMDGSAILFNYFTNEELSSLLDDAYSSHSPISSTVALCQLSAVAATGCQYYPELFDEPTRKAFLAVVRITLDECIEASPLGGIRVMALLCMYFTFEKRTSALVYAEMGLQIARMVRVKSASGRPESSSWRRTVGALVFLNCWLSATTGHLPEAMASDEGQSVLYYSLGESSTIDVVQQQLVKIAILTGLILQDVYRAKFVPAITLTSYKTKLEAWLANLPDFMRPAQLLGNKDNNFRAVFLVHLFYMYTLILLYRRVLVALADAGIKNGQAEIFGTAQEFVNPCLWSARQVGRILKISQENNLILRKCWMFISTSYCTCNVLLYFVANQLLCSEQSLTLGEDLEAAKTCLDILEYCRTYDVAAEQYLKNLTPLNNKLQEIYRSRMAPNSLPPEDQTADLRDVIFSSAGFLLHPFDGGNRREVQSVNNALTGLLKSPIPDRFLEIPDRGDSDQIRASFYESISTTSKDGLHHYFLNDVIGSVGFMGGSNRIPSDDVLSRTVSIMSMKGLVLGS